MEPVPEIVRQDALRAFDMRVADARIADLVYDPILDDDAPDTSSDRRVMHFSTGDESAVVSVAPGETGLCVALILTPATTATVELRNANDTWTLSTDAAGRLQVEGVPQGLISLVVRRAGQQPMQTAWVRI